MKRKFVMTDLHGQHTAAQTLLAHAGFHPQEDQLVILGDIIDQGPDSGELTQWLKALQTAHPEHVKTVTGNHELMMKWYVFKSKSNMWLRHGGLETIRSFNRTFQTEEAKDEHLEWLASLPFYFMDDEYLYVHAGLDAAYGLEKQPEDTAFMEVDELYFLNAQDLDDLIGERSIVHGHTAYQSVYRSGRFVSCDTGAAELENGRLSLVELRSRTVYSYHIETKQLTTSTVEEVETGKRIYDYRVSQAAKKADKRREK